MLERWLEVLSGARTREDFTPTTFKQQLPHSKYEFVSVLGKGGFAVVWKAFHKSTHTWVAIKVIDLDKLKHLGKLPETHIDRECDIMKSINHPNIVQLIEIYDDCDPELGRGKLFLVLEYLNGIDLQRRLDNGPPLNHETEAKEVLLQIGGALHYLHTLDIIHRDVKPGNIYILREPPFTTKLLDFGLAKQVEFLSKSVRIKQKGTAASEKELPGESNASKGKRPSFLSLDKSRRILPGSLVGTRTYAPPEMIHQRSTTYNMTVDAYSLGTTIRFILTGIPPKVCLKPSTIKPMVQPSSPALPTADEKQVQVRPAGEVEEVDIACCASCFPTAPKAGGGPSSSFFRPRKKYIVTYSELPEHVKEVIDGLTAPVHMRWTISDAISSTWVTGVATGPLLSEEMDISRR